MNSSLLIRSKDRGGEGVFAEVTAENAGWTFLNMQARRMNAGSTFSGKTGDQEIVHVIFGGMCSIETSAGTFEHIGRRPDVFNGMPWALYLSRNTSYTITANTDNLEIGSCWVAAEKDYPARLITPSDVQVELRGGENASRQINSIIPPGFPCQRLVCVEVYTPGGNWSSYPPHKHDIHRELPDGTVIEADLEEIYFYKIDRPEGYAYQRIYNDSRSLDELVMAQNHDSVLVPEGYHPVVSAHGYTTYYCNFLAGSAQSLANADDPDYAWVKENWRGIDSRLPIVTHAMEG
jgi:5-deoxy-glucuronate isomerase